MKLVYRALVAAVLLSPFTQARAAGGFQIGPFAVTISDRSGDPALLAGAKLNVWVFPNDTSFYCSTVIGDKMGKRKYLHSFPIQSARVELPAIKVGAKRACLATSIESKGVEYFFDVDLESDATVTGFTSSAQIEEQIRSLYVFPHFGGKEKVTVRVKAPNGQTLGQYAESVQSALLKTFNATPALSWTFEMELTAGQAGRRYFYHSGNPVPSKCKVEWPSSRFSLICDKDRALAERKSVDLVFDLNLDPSYRAYKKDYPYVFTRAKIDPAEKILRTKVLAFYLGNPGSDRILYGDSYLLDNVMDYYRPNAGPGQIKLDIAGAELVKRTSQDTWEITLAGDLDPIVKGFCCTQRGDWMKL